MNGQETETKITPYSLKNFIRRVNNASVRKRWRDSQLEEIGSRMKELSGTYPEGSYGSYPGASGAIPEQDIRVRKIADAERTIARRQMTEQREIDILRENVKMLEEKLEALSHIHSFVTDTHAQRIAELQEVIKKSREEKKGLDMMAKEEIHKFVLEKVKPKEDEKQARKEADLAKKEAMKEKAIKMRSIQKSISDAEKLYSRLKKKGHPKDDLQRLKVTIDSYKRRADELKK
ncbi:hypothetical protein COV19_06725 [Candidatus Woesearchaeota archaeon CG10_big_fil_rev_8_21_14_0_10_44_13]|nr:MAG: hypothetical protein COV19_06725 [Candidatus Woesearchaeota archaeon CG10_big_fil_rev_8_21_14_0_10_44_13]